MAIVYDSVATPGYGASSWTHVVPAGGCLVVLNGDWNTGALTAVTYGGVALTRHVNHSGNDRIELWVLTDVSQAVGNTVSISGPGTRYPTSLAFTADGQVFVGAAGTFGWSSQSDWQNWNIDVTNYPEYDAEVGHMVVSVAGSASGAFSGHLQPLSGTDHVRRRVWGGSNEGFACFTGTGPNGGFYKNGSNAMGAGAVSLYDVPLAAKPKRSIFLP